MGKDVLLSVVFKLGDSLKRLRIPLPTIKDILAAGQSLTIILAGIAGGWWFFMQHQFAKRPKIEHLVSTHMEALTKTVLAVVQVKASNIGNVPINIPKGTIRLIRRNSEGQKILSNEVMAEHSLEPGQSEQIYFNVFSFPANYGTIQVETHVPTSKRREIQTDSVFDVKPDVDTALTENSGRMHQK